MFYLLPTITTCWTDVGHASRLSFLEMHHGHDYVLLIHSSRTGWVYLFTPTLDGECELLRGGSLV
jgi:hypothetical protein